MGDGVSMALGKYLSTRSEQDLYQTARDKESYEIIHNQQMEYDECIDILTQQGMKTQDATMMIDVMKSYPHIRVKWMMDNELEMSDVRHENASLQGLITFLSFIFFGTIPLVPYLFAITQDNHRTVSIIMTGLALLLLGLVRRWITRGRIVATIFQVLILGIAAALVAYLTGYLVANFF